MYFRYQRRVDTTDLSIFITPFEHILHLTNTVWHVVRPFSILPAHKLFRSMQMEPIIACYHHRGTVRSVET